MKKMTLNRIDESEYSEREQVNTICSNLSFSGKNIKTILITSSNAGEGKSYVASKMALNMAMRGMDVILVDADLRRSNLAGSFKMYTGTNEIIGLAHYLTGQAEMEDVIYQTNVDHFFIVPQGRDLGNPVPLLNSDGFAKLVKHLEQNFGMVIIDTPPIGLVIDAAEIARTCDGIVMIAAHGRTRRKEFRDALSVMEKTGCQILGCVLNKVSFDRVSYRKYYNKYYYSHYSSHYYKNDKPSKK